MGANPNTPKTIPDTQDDPRLQHAFKLYQAGMSDIDVARNTGIKRTTFIRYRKKFNIKR